MADLINVLKAHTETIASQEALLRQSANNQETLLRELARSRTTTPDPANPVNQGAVTTSGMRTSAATWAT